MDFHIVDYFIDATKKWVIILPSSWMNEERTQFWIPQVKGTEFKRLCKAKSQPQRDWTCYYMLVRKSYGTYNDAREDLSRAEQHSDLNIDNELHGMQIDHSGRKASSRVRRPRECYSPPVSKRVHSAVVGAVTDKEEDEQLLSLPASLQVSSVQHNFGANFHQQQSYAIGGLSSVHSFPGAGPSSVQSYAIACPSVPSYHTAGPSSALSYPISGSPSMQSYSLAGPSTVQINSTAGPSSVRGNCVDGPSSNSTTGPSSVQSYSVFGPSSAHNYPGAGQSSVQNYPTAGPSPLHHYPTAGPSSVHHYSTAGPTSVQHYPTAGSSSVQSCPTAGPSSLITSQVPIRHSSGSGPVTLTGISTSSESSGLGGPVPEIHRLQPQQQMSMLPMSAGASRNLRVNEHLTIRGSGMSSSANLELPIDSIRGSDVKKIPRRIEMVVENQLQHNKDLEQLENQARPNGSIYHPTITEIQGLPLQTMAELECYEISLWDEEIRHQLVGMISTTEGNGFKDAVERALAAVASDKVLRDVNWLGRKKKDKQKKGCHDMLFIKSILQGVRKQPDFEDVVRHNNRALRGCVFFQKNLATQKPMSQRNSVFV